MTTRDRFTDEIPMREVPVAPKPKSKPKPKGKPKSRSGGRGRKPARLVRPR
jgi:hypothetical protein